MNSSVDISVVIGFKDWGSERLLVSIRSILQSFGSLRGEVIVSDYGSEATAAAKLKSDVEEAGGRYVYTATNGIWSRSRALNAGFAVSNGAVLVSTDADMLFTPRSMQVIGLRVLENPNEAVVLQCRDLPERLSVEAIDPEGFSWQEYAEASTLRPRWGMGGMMAVSRQIFMSVRGFDERMEIYGGEDMDFAQRVRRAGCRLLWITHPDVRMYHIWHPSSRKDADQTPEGTAAIKYNRNIFQNDPTYVRNTKDWKHRPFDAPPLASVVITTRNRGEYIAESIYSVLNQTVQDFELIIVDDGSTDDTEIVIKSIDDTRIRYFKREPAGIAASRNFAASVSRSEYTVVHDDDDIMFPDRIENHFKALTAGTSGTYGGWIDFQNTDAADCKANPGREFSLEALLFSSKVYAHATLMLKTDLIRQIRYDEHFRSGSDYNLAVRLARSGVNLVHTGHFHLIRRLHDKQVTAADSSVQQSSARISSGLALRSIATDKQRMHRESMAKSSPVAIKGADNPYGLIAPYLPDHLVKRSIRIPTEQLSLLPSWCISDQRMSKIAIIDNLSGAVVSSHGVIEKITWPEMAALSMAGISYELTVASESQSGPRAADSSMTSRLLANLMDTVQGMTNPADGLLILSAPSGLIPDIAAEIVADVTTAHGSGEVIHARAYALPAEALVSGIRGNLRDLDHSVSARYIAGASSLDALTKILGGSTA